MPEDRADNSDMPPICPCLRVCCAGTHDDQGYKLDVQAPRRDGGDDSTPYRRVLAVTRAVGHGDEWWVRDLGDVMVIEDNLWMVPFGNLLFPLSLCAVLPAHRKKALKRAVSCLPQSCVGIRGRG